MRQIGFRSVIAPPIYCGSIGVAHLIVVTYIEASEDTRVQLAGIKRANAYARILMPCFSTTLSSFKAMPLGCFAPVSHFSTVDSLVLR